MRTATTDLLIILGAVLIAMLASPASEARVRARGHRARTLAAQKAGVAPGVYRDAVAESSHSALTCQANGSGAFVSTNESGKTMGAFGFTSQTYCEQVVRKSQHGELICSWTGKGYGLYNTRTGLRYGPEDDGLYWTSLDDCADAAKVQGASSPAVCAWNGHKYIPYSRADNTPLSALNTGWEKLDECVSDAVKTATPQAVCGWNGADYLYTINGKMIPYKFGSTESCHSFLSMYKSAPAFSKVIETLASDGALSLSPSAIRNGEPDASVGFSGWKKCEVAADAYHLTKNENGVLVPGCRPDTLYSWGGFDKLDWFKRHMANGAAWPQTLARSLFTTESAAATFGYGPIPIRFKIKPNVIFKRVNSNGDTCEDIVSTRQAVKSEFESTIFQRVVLRDTGLSFVDFIICSPKVVASWSAGLPEHYDEIMRDYAWMTTQNYYQWEAYTKKSGVDVFLDNNIDADGYKTDFSQATFNLRMDLLRVLAVSGEGMIAAEKGGSTADHFATRWPIYFNPN